MKSVKSSSAPRLYISQCLRQGSEIALPEDAPPRYDQITLNPEDRRNTLQQILSPNSDDAGVWIHQDAWFHLGTFDKEVESDYTIKKEGNGVYAFVLKGQFKLNEQQLDERDGLGIWDIAAFKLKAMTQNAEILLMEVPMLVG